MEQQFAAPSYHSFRSIRVLLWLYGFKLRSAQIRSCSLRFARPSRDLFHHPRFISSSWTKSISDLQYKTIKTNTSQILVTTVDLFNINWVCSANCCCVGYVCFFVVEVKKWCGWSNLGGNISDFHYSSWYTLTNRQYKLSLCSQFFKYFCATSFVDCNPIWSQQIPSISK